MRGQGLPHHLMGGHRRLLAGPARGAGDQPLLDRQQLRGGPAALLQGPVGDHADRPLGQEPVRQLFQLGPGSTGQTGAEGDQDIRAGEGGRGRRQPLRAGQPIEQPTDHLRGHRPVLWAVSCPAGHRPDQGVRVHAALGCLRPPPAIQGVRGLVLLGLAGGMDGPLDQPRRPLPTVGGQPVQLGVDLAGPLGESTDQRLGYPLELAVAVAVRGCPLHPQCPDELPLVGGPVDGVGGQPMPIQVPSVHGCPAAVRPPNAVGDHQMRVQQRIAFSGRPVVEPDRQHPLSGHVLDTTVAAAGPQVLVQVGYRLGQPTMMGLEHGPAGGWVTEAIQDRDTLGRPQHHIEGGHRIAAVGAAEQLAGCGVAALEHGLEPGHRCFALQPQAGGAGAVPPARGLAVAGQIRFVVGGQLTGVIRLPPYRELGDVGHHPVAPSRRRWRQQRTAGALLSSEKFVVGRV
jgi:hypothetical protein